MASRPGTAILQQQRLPSFQHERLKLKANSIRLVQIHGSTVKGGPLSLRITQYAKHKRPSYVAISYTWGTSKELHAVQINGRPFYVHTNLYNLLLYLRQRGENRCLFVDALCIDQANLAERNFHVQLMAQIYDEAACTLVWLGTPSDDRREARAIDFVVEMATFLEKTKRGALAGFSKQYMIDAVALRWANLMRFCRVSYWTRVWIVQEFLQARSIEMVCGMAALDWVSFARVLSAVRDHYRTGAGVIRPLDDILTGILDSIPARLTSRRLTAQASPLEDLLREFYDSECSEPRDKVYGILGIASDCGEQPSTGLYFGPQPDYGKHIVDIYFDVLAHLRDTSPFSSVSPLTTLLLQKSLQIRKSDILDGVAKRDEAEIQTKILQQTLRLRPSYMSTVSDTISNWSTIRELRQRLDDFDWSNYVGYTMQPRRPQTPKTPSSPTPSFTSPVRSITMQRNLSSTSRTLNTLPKDLISNVLSVAEVNPSLSTLYNYLPQANGFHLPISILDLHHEDKQRLFSPTTPPARPTLIVETSELAHPLRTGFAPPGTRRGDIICQFSGTDLTLIARPPIYGGQSLQLVGRAVMVKHEGLEDRQCEVHPVCRTGMGSWGSSCLEKVAVTEGVASNDGDGVGTLPGTIDGPFSHELIETDAISMFEILRGGEIWSHG